MLMQCAPAFNYARSSHQTTILEDSSTLDSKQVRAVFESDELSLDLRYVPDTLLVRLPLSIEDTHLIHTTYRTTFILRKYP